MSGTTSRTFLLESQKPLKPDAVPLRLYNLPEKGKKTCMTKSCKERRLCSLQADQKPFLTRASLNGKKYGNG